MRCPTCESDNVQRLSVAYKSGLSTSENTTSGVGIGFSGGGLGAGVGAAKTQGVHQTQLSVDTRPPTKFNVLAAIFIYLKWWFITTLVVGLLLGASSLKQYDNLIIGGIAIGFIVAFLHRAYNGLVFNKNVFPDAMTKWQNGFICLKCGEMFVDKRHQIHSS